MSRDYRSPDVFSDATLLDRQTLGDIESAPTEVLERIAGWEPQTRSQADLEFVSRAIIELARRDLRRAQSTQRMLAVSIERLP